MAKFKVVLLKHGYPSIQNEREVVTAAGGDFIDADGLTDAEGIRQCEDAEAVLVRWLPITPDLIQRFRRCRIIVRYGVGYDNVDVQAATLAGVIVGHIPQYCLDEVSTHTVALLLACVRNVVGKHNKMERGAWDINPLERIYRTAGRTLGLVGFGNIGQAVARKMGGWGLRLLATDPYVEPARAAALGVQLVSLPELLCESDYVSLHVPLLPETRRLIGAEQLALMKPGAILVNTARGPVLDNTALLAALRSGRLAQAALDVFEHEPPAPDSPLRHQPGLIISDHVAWYSEESQAELQRTAAEEVVRVCQGGLPRAIANPEVLERLGRVLDWVPNDNARWQLKRLAALSGPRPA
ncbi:MAG: C-terminal binding protein [Verrucomicrobiota bacterium]